MPRLCLLRHGQSQWNLENRFTGWVDVNLTPQGEAEAARAGILLAEAGFAPDIAFTSVLTRAILTLNIALYGLGRLWVPVTKSWRLNERHYGGLTGLDKAETAARHGDAQVKIWRRSFDVPPPPLTPGEGHPSLRDARYKGIDVPATESLKLTLERVGPFWTDSILPAMATQDVLVAAHGNSLRAVVKALFGVSDEDIIGVEIPTGNPLLIDLSADLRPTAARYLDPARAQDLPPVPGAARGAH